MKKNAVYYFTTGTETVLPGHCMDVETATKVQKIVQSLTQSNFQEFVQNTRESGTAKDLDLDKLKSRVRPPEFSLVQVYQYASSNNIKLPEITEAESSDLDSLPIYAKAILTPSYRLPLESPRVTKLDRELYHLTHHEWCDVESFDFFTQRENFAKIYEALAHYFADEGDKILDKLNCLLDPRPSEDEKQQVVKLANEFRAVRLKKIEDITHAMLPYIESTELARELFESRDRKFSDYYPDIKIQHHLIDERECNQNSSMEPGL